MRVAYQRSQDLHTLTAAAIRGCAPAAVTKADRQLAKALNFGLIYGMGAPRLREHAFTQYAVTLTGVEAARFKARFLETYPGIRAWHRSQPDGAIETRTRAGRRRLAVKNYTETTRLYVRPSLGHVKLARLEPTHIQALYSGLASRELVRTPALAHAVLHRACRIGVLWGWLGANSL